MFIYKGKVVLPTVVDYFIGFIYIAIPSIFFAGGLVYSITQYIINPSSVNNISLVIAFISFGLFVVTFTRVHELMGELITKFIYFHFDSEVYLFLWCSVKHPYLVEKGSMCEDFVVRKGDETLITPFFTSRFKDSIVSYMGEIGKPLSNEELHNLNNTKKDYKNLRKFIKRNEEVLKFASL